MSDYFEIENTRLWGHIFIYYIIQYIIQNNLKLSNEFVNSTCIELIGNVSDKYEAWWFRT